MKQIILFCFVFLFLNLSAKQKNWHYVYYEEIDRYIVFNKGDNYPRKVITENVLGQAHIICDNFFGKSSIRNYYYNGHLQMEGQYLESIGLLKEYTLNYDIGLDKTSKIIREYYQPIQDGKWKYYDFDGKIIKEINFDKGVPRDSVIYKTEINTEFNKSYSVLFWEDSITFKKGERQKLDSILVKSIMPILKDTSYLVLISPNVSQEEYSDDPLIGKKRCAMIINYLESKYKISKNVIFISDNNSNIGNAYGFTSSAVTISIIHQYRNGMSQN